MQNTTVSIERKETGIRMLFSVLFMLIAEVVHTILVFAIFFSLAFALITKRPPSGRVRQFANKTLSYLYYVLRYLTYNASEPPFPFTDFPSELEPPSSSEQARREANAPPTDAADAEGSDSQGAGE